MTLWAVALLAVAAPACGGDDAAVDPRCESVCAIDEPPVAGAYDICSEASADQCRRECTARIADVATVCGTCLIEEACFAPDCGGDSPGDFCEAGQCTVTGREGQCTYPEGDTAAREDCLRQVYPRRVVECATEYRPVSECGASCGGAADAGITGSAR